MLSFARLTDLLYLVGQGHILANHIFVRVEAAVGAGALRELLALVHFGISCPVVLQSLSVVKFGLVVFVSNVVPLSSEGCAGSDFALLEGMSLDVTGAGDDGAILVLVVLFNFLPVAHVLIRRMVVVVLLHDLGRLERDLVASVQMTVLLGVSQNGSYRFIEGAACKIRIILDLDTYQWRCIP